MAYDANGAMEMRFLYLYVVVFVSGGAVLSLEILGTRILGPFYGVSLFLWSALITVTLVALSAGYALGGRYADRGATMSRLYALVAVAGLWILAVPWVTRSALELVEPFGLRLAVLVAAFILFGPPLLFLGMVSPYAIRLRASSLDVVGRAAGNLYAISTVGSVVAALATGFFLIPSVGITRLTIFTGALLLAIVAIGLALDGKARGRWAALALVAIATASSLLSPAAAPDPAAGLIAVRQSPYAEIRVVDLDGHRHLLIDGGVHTITEPGSWRSTYPYTAVVDLSRHFFASPGGALLIGLGGGSVVKRFAHEGWNVEAVEIDPVVVDIATEYFGLEAEEGTVHVVDGRRFLTTTSRLYDVIVMDAFGSGSIPFHLATVESFGLIESHLDEGGVFVVNLESNGWEDRIVRSMSATLAKHFDYVVALPAHRSPTELGNVLLFASQRELSLVQDLQRDLARREDRFKIFAWDNRFIPESAGADVLTDDRNPLDLWSEAINRVARDDLHSYFEDGVSW